MLKKISKVLLLLSCILILASFQVLAADSASDLKSQRDRESYSIGYQVGASIKMDGVEVDFDRLVQGLKDAMNNKEPKMEKEEMKNLIVDLKTKAREAQIKELQEQKAANTEESREFLVANKLKEGVMTTESGLQYKVLKEGKGISPGPDDTVTVNYRGRFIDGTEFDSSYERGEPAKFKVKGVIKGWTEAMQMMKPGARWELYIPPKLAYGGRGAPPSIPPNKVLVFEVELLAIEQNADVSKNLSGQIVKSRNGYVIRSRRGNAPGEIYTVLNPDPGILDGFVKSEKVVSIDVRTVSGDNVEIVRIDGKDYGSESM